MRLKSSPRPPARPAPAGSQKIEEPPLMESGANTFPPFQSYFCLSPSACFPRSGLVYFLCVCVPPRVQSLSECVCFWEPPFTLKGLNRPFSRLSTFPGSPGGKSLLEFCSPPTLVSSARCCSRRVISMTIVLGLSGARRSHSVGPLSGQKELHLCAFERVM